MEELCAAIDPDWRKRAEGIRILRGDPQVQDPSCKKNRRRDQNSEVFCVVPDDVMEVRRVIYSRRDMDNQLL